MTKLEKAKKDLSETLTPEQWKIVDPILNGVKLPSNAKVNLCKSLMDGSMSLSSISDDRHVLMTDAEINKMDVEIQAGGKDTLMNILDKAVNIKDPKFKQLMNKYHNMLVQIREDREKEKLEHFEKKRQEEIRKKRSYNLNKIVS